MATGMEGAEELTVKFSVRTLDRDGQTSFDVVEPESALVVDVKQRLARRLGVDGNSSDMQLLLWGCDLDDTKSIFESKVVHTL